MSTHLGLGPRLVAVHCTASAEKARPPTVTNSTPQGPGRTSTTWLRCIDLTPHGLTMRTRSDVTSTFETHVPRARRRAIPSIASPHGNSLAGVPVTQDGLSTCGNIRPSPISTATTPAIVLVHDIPDRCLATSRKDVSGDPGLGRTARWVCWA